MEAAGLVRPGRGLYRGQGTTCVIKATLMGTCSFQARPPEETHFQ